MKQIKRIAAIFLTIFISTTFAFAQAKTNESGKIVKYIEMTKGEKRQFIEDKTNEMLNLFRRVKGDEVTDEGIQRIQTYVEFYLRRTSPKKNGQSGCGFGDELSEVLKRGTSIAPTIGKSFSKQDLPSQAGIYLVMIESEFCPCLQSPTGPLGMFQFTMSMAKERGLQTKSDASPGNPDERCDPEKASQAASVLFNDFLNINFGRNAIGFPLSVAAYNAGQGATKKNLQLVQGETKTEDVSFWLMSDVILAIDQNGQTEKEFPVSKQFLLENHKYVPKFFAAAIIGENPRVFGFEMSPLSQVK